MALSDITSFEGEMAGWPRTTWIQGDFRGERKLICAWEDIVWMLSELDKEKKWPYNGAPQSVQVVAYRADTEPLPGAQTNEPGDSVASYDKVVVTVQYGMWYQSYEGSSDLIDERIQPHTEYSRVSPRGLYWDSAQSTQLVGSEAPTRLASSFDYITTFRNKHTVPAWVQSFTNHTNSNRITAPMLGMVFEPETLLFRAPTLERATSYSAELWHVHRTLAFRGAAPSNAANGHATWNQVWRGSTGQYETVYKSDGSEWKNFPAVVF